MAKKTLLNEAQVRRFMGLAGMQAMTVSNVIKEMGYHEAEDDMADAEMDDEEVVMEVAKRVARRIMKARRAQKMLDEALGNK